ncbi:MAG: hypothetical protein QNJ56_06535 [Gammaproteobacteria bacterium]|nr:hypothetical protein [Gammaproteobacteria bacterium]
MTYRIEATDPVTGKPLKQLMNMPYVIESNNEDDLIIYFESEKNRDIYLKNPDQHELQHYNTHPGDPHIAA